AGRRPAAYSGKGVSVPVEVPGANASALQDVFARALADDPADRFSTGLAFAEAFKDAVLAQPAAPHARAGDLEIRPPNRSAEPQVSESAPLTLSLGTLDDREDTRHNENASGQLAGFDSRHGDDLSGFEDFAMGGEFLPEANERSSVPELPE